MDNGLHHYVPQFYLKRFVGHGDMLWVYDKDRDRTFHTTPKNMAAEHGFYSLPDVFEDSSIMEKQFSELEGEAAKITEDWLIQFEFRNFIELPDINREIMSLYFTTQLMRTAESRALLVEGVEGSREAAYEEEIHRALHTFLLWDEDTVDEVSDWVKSCIWTFRVNESTDSLYTSDDPLKARTSTQHLHWAQLPTAGAYLLFPLTPKLLMYCFDAEKWTDLEPFDCVLLPFPLEPELVRDSNVHQVGHARRFVFSDQDNFRLAREFCSRNPGAVGESRQRFIR